MKQADIIRLGLAYVLIAASGGEAKAPFERHVQGASFAAPAAGAKSPVDVPVRGWVDIARSVWIKIGKNRVIAVAAGLTFYGLLAIFPTVTALVSVYGLFADPAAIKDQLQNLAGSCPTAHSRSLAIRCKGSRRKARALWALPSPRDLQSRCGAPIRA